VDTFVTVPLGVAGNAKFRTARHPGLLGSFAEVVAGN
jgi:hypothetical protein